MLPSFLRKLSDPAIKTVFVCGCGGGFDFVHSMTLYPELMRLKKKVIIGSYSFGMPSRIGEAPTVYEDGKAIVKRVTATSEGPGDYAPEVLLLYPIVNVVVVVDTKCDVNRCIWRDSWTKSSQIQTDLILFTRTMQGTPLQPSFLIDAVNPQLILYHYGDGRGSSPSLSSPSLSPPSPSVS